MATDPTTRSGSSKATATAVLLIVAGALFLVAAALDETGITLRYVAGGLLILAGVLRLLRARRA